MGFSKQEYWSGVPLPSLSSKKLRYKYAFYFVESDISITKEGILVKKKKPCAKPKEEKNQQEEKV